MAWLITIPAAFKTVGNMTHDRAVLLRSETNWIRLTFAAFLPKEAALASCEWLIGI
jgi:hypothetical protein